MYVLNFLRSVQNTISAAISYSNNNSVEGPNVINGPKCNKVPNVIIICPKCNTVITRISPGLK